MSSFWNNFSFSQDEMELVVSASKDARDILTQSDKKTELARTMIDILNEKSYKELQYLAIRDRPNLVIESNKVITKKSLAHNVLDLASQLYHDVGTFKSLFDHLIHQGILSPWDGNRYLYPQD